jgi:hypothetical protein
MRVCEERKAHDAAMTYMMERGSNEGWKEHPGRKIMMSDKIR